MDRLPDEVILHILAYLQVRDIIRAQSVSKRFLALGRDNSLWKLECFDHSRAESLRRRQQSTLDARLVDLRNAWSALPGGDLSAWDVSQLRGSPQPRASFDPQAEARNQRARALANWEPGYPSERLDYYEEFIHRHAPIAVSWLDLPKSHTSDKEELREATGIGVLRDAQGSADRVVAPLDDGSVCIWDVSTSSKSHSGGRGKLLSHSRSGLLTGKSPDSTSESHTIMTETSAVECVSINQQSNKGYLAVQNHLHELDLSTLQVSSTKQYPFPITALSEAAPLTPVTVGTNWTLHLHDPRDSSSPSPSDGELIGGTPYTHATLTQPGPLSILHHSATSSLWIAGRFTHLLNYDTRFFPRLLGTLHSGARTPSMSLLPYPFIPRSLDLTRNPSLPLSSLTTARRSSGTTLLTAGSYKGKGSLELHGLPTTPSSPPYQNRQTASASKLLSVAPHGGKIVFSDGDGNLKWMERDGVSVVRTFNINDAITNLPSTSSSPSPTPNANDPNTSTGLFTSENPATQGDIIQKIIPISLPSSTSTPTPTPSPSPSKGMTTNNLLLWTGDGRLGVLGFGHDPPFSPTEAEFFVDAKETQEGEGREEVERRAREDAERQYGMAMRRALERNADEVRFVRGLGMGV